MSARGVDLSRERRVRVERGIYRQPNGKYAVCFMLEGKARFRTVGHDLQLARRERETLARAASYGVLACAPRLRFSADCSATQARPPRCASTRTCLTTPATLAICVGRSR